MAEYIEREAAYREICADDTLSGYEKAYCSELIRNIPAADVAQVRHGRWECVYDDSTGETDITCYHCKNTRTVNGCFVSTDGKSCYFEDDYCPNCGAKMDQEV